MSHIKARLSNLVEHFFISLYQFINQHMRFIIIEPDTSLATDADVSNAAITISSCLAAEISKCGINTTTGQCNVMVGVLRGTKREFFVEWCAEKGSVPLQYCPQFHTFGFQPWHPTATRLLHMLGVPVWHVCVLPVSRVCRYPDGHWLYRFTAASILQCWFAPFAYIIKRNAFRYIDSRYK